MKSNSNNEHILFQRILYTVGIIFIYMLGRNIPLYGIDLNAYKNVEINAQTIFMQSLSGDIKNVSIFILGIWPYMLASMAMLLYMAIKSLDKTTKTSPKKMNRLTYTFMTVIAVVSAFQKVNSFVYVDTPNLLLVKIIVFIELMAGMFIVVNLCVRNEKYGIGGRTAVMIANILDGLRNMLAKLERSDYVIMAVIILAAAFIMVILENTEKRMPVQRVSIHNIYADKNYLAYKLNPAGAMPLMFATSAFMLPQLFCNLLAGLYPESDTMRYAAESMKLTEPMGVITYIAIIWILTILFSILIISPWNTAESLMKAGDSILDIHAGKQTKRYLFFTVFRFSIYSSVILSICIGIPLVLSLNGIISQSVVMIPCSIMMVTGLWLNISRELVVYKHIDSYKPFV